MSVSSLARPTVVVIAGGVTAASMSLSRSTTWPTWCWWNPRTRSSHNVAALRALADPSWLPKIFFPYARAAVRGRVVRDRAVKVEPGRVALASGNENSRPTSSCWRRGRTTVPGQEAMSMPPPPPRTSSRPPMRRSRRRRESCSSAPGRSASSWRRDQRGGGPDKHIALLRRGRRRPGRPVPAGPQRRACAASSPHPGVEFAAVQSAPAGSARRSGRAGGVHRSDRVGPGGDRRCLVPLLRVSPGQRLPGRRAGLGPAARTDSWR